MTTSASTQSQGRIQLMETGIPGFDEIVGGGLPKHSLYLIQGLAGSGKTTLACQMGFAHAKKGEKVLILTLIAESHAKMINHFSNFSFYDESLIGNQIMFHGAYPSLARGGLRELLKLITASLSEQKPSILIVDGFRSIRNSSPSDLDLSEFMHSLNSLVASMGCTTFLLSPIEGNVPDSENTLVDGLIELSQHEDGMRLVREVKVFKMRGANHLLGKHAFAVCPDGIVMYPRLETTAGKRKAVLRQSAAVMRMKGMFAVCGSPLTLRHRDTPSSSGIMKSDRIKSGRFSSIRRKACAPLYATTTSKLLISSMRLSTSTASRSSSTMRIFCIKGSHSVSIILARMRREICRGKGNSAVRKSGDFSYKSLSKSSHRQAEGRARESMPVLRSYLCILQTDLPAPLSAYSTQSHSHHGQRK